MNKAQTRVAPSFPCSLGPEACPERSSKACPERRSSAGADDRSRMGVPASPLPCSLAPSLPKPALSEVRKPALGGVRKPAMSGDRPLGRTTGVEWGSPLLCSVSPSFPRSLGPCFYPPRPLHPPPPLASRFPAFLFPVPLVPWSLFLPPPHTFQTPPPHAVL